MSEDLIELIRLMNEKPIAFNKHYVFLGCGINGAVMLSQLVYWSDKSKDRNGWIYKTSKDWTEETGLTRREQDTARKNLRELGFIEEHKHGIPCKTHYRVNKEALYNALIGLAQNSQSNAHISQTDAQKRQTDAHISQTNTENTSKITTDINNKRKFKFNPKEMDLPPNVDYKLWCEFVDMRSDINKKLPERSAKMILSELESFGVTANESLSNAIKATWLKPYAVKQNNYQQPASTRMQEIEQLRQEWELNNESDYTPY